MEPLKGVHSQLLLGGGQNLKIPIYCWIKSGAPPKVFGCFRGCLHPSHDPPSKVLEVRFSEVGTESFSVSLPFSFFKKDNPHIYKFAISKVLLDAVGHPDPR